MAIESSSDHDDAAAVVRAKRRIAALEQEVEVLRASNKRVKPQIDSNVHKGRAIRRLVSLFDGLEDLIAENDRREELLDSLDLPDQLVSTQDEDRTIRSFNELLRCLPWLKKKLSSDVDELDYILRDLRKGADSARGDDTANLKHVIVAWLTELFHPLDPPLHTNIKDDRGFIHHITGKLLCPVEYTWSLNLTKEKIRDRDPDFLVTAYSWPAMLYLDYTFDSGNIEKGLFRSALLLKAFKHIFTSPSSAKEVDGDGDGADAIVASQRRRSSESDMTTRSHLRFSLSNVNSWQSIDGDFDYYVFYNNIVDFFEVAPGIDAQARIKELLKWWNRKVFGKTRAIPLTPAQLGRFSVSRMTSQRAVHEGGSP
ncbi:uncharacterized protein HD556DRAFT_1248044 [Suillus plorans]|uniref:Uncharacterized protein n=1 Tax=Suillus plorans TaxID=116603 RepID=A0A9P7DBI9_9AGAM|nr:uncharacterized protein HD556DRAFT_1248044 [Suillus plorans]KAG1786639.1 hypothetical protein HD556DRAFT_1248044 [Suillus plorans]